MRTLLSVIVTGFMLGGCETWNQVTTQRPAETIREKADFQYERGNFERAAGGYAEIAARYPGDWRAQHRLGQCLMETGDLPEARRALEVAHTLRPNEREIVESLAEVMYRQHDETHLFAFLRERAEATKSVWAYQLLSKYSMEMGDMDSAKLAIDTAIALDQRETVDPYLAAADLAQRLGDLDLAVGYLRDAYWINPHDNRVVTRLRDLDEVPGPTLARP